jgi:hypothetical protein
MQEGGLNRRSSQTLRPTHREKKSLWFDDNYMQSRWRKQQQLGFENHFMLSTLWSDLCNCSLHIYTYTFEWSCKELMIDSIPLMIESLIMKHSSIIQTIKQLIESRRIITPQQDSMPSHHCTNPLASPPWVHALNLSSPLLPFHPDSKYKKLLTLNVGASIMQLLNKSTRAEIIKRIRGPPNLPKKHLTSLPVTL